MFILVGTTSNSQALLYRFSETEEALREFVEKLSGEPVGWMSRKHYGQYALAAEVVDENGDYTFYEIHEETDAPYYLVQWHGMGVNFGVWGYDTKEKAVEAMKNGFYGTYDPTMDGKLEETEAVVDVDTEDIRWQVIESGVVKINGIYLTPATIEAAYRYQERAYRTQDALNHAEDMGIVIYSDVAESLAEEFLENYDSNVAENDQWEALLREFE